MAWDSIKVDGSSTLPASEWNTMVSAINAKLVSTSIGTAALLNTTNMGNLTVGAITSATAGSDFDFNAYDIKDLGLGTFKVYAHGNTGTSTTIDWNNGAFQTATLTGNCTFTFTAPTVDASNYVRLCLLLSQDATGSRTATWPATVRWVGNTAATLTTTTSREDIITLIYNGTNYAAVASLNFDL